MTFFPVTVYCIVDQRKTGVQHPVNLAHVRLIDPRGAITFSDGTVLHVAVDELLQRLLAAVDCFDEFDRVEVIQDEPSTLDLKWEPLPDGDSRTVVKVPTGAGHELMAVDLSQVTSVHALGRAQALAAHQYELRFADAQGVVRMDRERGEYVEATTDAPFFLTVFDSEELRAGLTHLDPPSVG